MKIRVMGYVKINHLSPSLSPSPALELSPGPSPAAEDSAQPRKPFSEPWLMIPRGNGENPNFVSSNPVIPLPVGTTDDDINRSLPETGDGNKVCLQKKKRKKKKNFVSSLFTKDREITDNT